MRTHRALPGIAALLLASCGGSAGPATSGKPVVAVTVLPQAWFVTQLAGDAVAVEVLLPPGANPATYEPSPAQIRRLDAARLYVAVGHPAFPFERVWLARILENRPGLRALVPEVGQTPGQDPHVWLSPAWIRGWIPQLSAALQELLPEDATLIDARAAALDLTVGRLDEEIHDRLAPYAGRAFLVVHPAWGRFARRYGLVQLALERNGKEPSARQLEALIARAQDAQIRVVFVEPQFSDRTARVLADELGARVTALDPLAPGWLANMRHVAEALVESFQP